MADNFSALRTSRGEPSLFEQVRTTAQLTPEAQYEMTSGASDTQFEKGLRFGAAGLTAGSFANEALSQEVGGDADWQRSRDLALQTQAQGQMYAPRVSSLRDIGSLEDAGDFAAGAIGQGVMYMAPTLATALLTRGLGKFGAATSFAGGATTAYGLERGEAALNQYADPTLAATSAEDRDLAATTKGVINAGLEAIVPAGLAGSVLRKPAGSFLGHVGRESLTEGLTEAAQQGVGFGAEKYLDPNRQLDPWDVADAFAAGALTGGGMSAATRGPAHGAQALVDRFTRGQQGDAAPIDLNPPSAPMEGAPPGTPLLPGPEDGGDAGGLFDTLNERFGPGIREQAQRTKDYVSDTIDRMGEAAKTAQSPGDFLRQVFGSSTEDAAAADLRPDTEDPGVLNSADPAAALQQRDAERQERAAAFAEELLNDPATPDAIKERVASFGGDFTNPEARAFVARNLVSQRAGEKLANAVGDLIDLSKDFGGKAVEVGTDLVAKVRGMIDNGMTAATDRIVKKSLQDINEADVAPLVALMAQRLGPTKAVEAPRLARQLVAAANRLSPDARITEETDRRLRNFSEVIDDEVLDLVTELSGSDALRNSITKIRAIPSARSDVRQSNGQSFLESMLKQPLEPAVMGQLADFVDATGLQLGSMSSERKNQVLSALASAFGSKREAQTVVEYYGNIRRDAFRREAEAGTLADDRPSADAAPGETVATVTNPDGTVSYGEEFGSLTEQDTAEMTASYRDPNPARPFFRSTDRAALRDARRAAPAGSRVASLREYVAQTGEAPQAVAARIRQDLRKRLTDAENRDTATVQEAIASMEAVPEAARNEDFNQLLSQLKSRKTENRTDLPGLRKQMEAIEKASGVSFKEVADLNKRIRRAELADNDDSANLPALRKQLSKLEDRYAKNAEKVLEKYAVVMRPKDETFANDELVAKFRGILEKLPNANVGTPAERAKKREDIAKIKKTAVKFNRKGGKTPITLSAESMAYSSQARGSMEERFLDSLAAVLARPDIEGLVPPAPDTLISRQTGLTWGDISPEKTADNRTERQKKAQRAKDATAAWAKQERMRADIETRPKLMAALRDVQRRFLADRLGLTLAPDEATSLTDLIGRFPAAQRRAMRTEANEAAFQSALGWAKKLSRKQAAASERNFTDESRMRVLEEYIDEQLDDRFPMPEGDERASRRLAEEEQAAGVYADEGGIGGAILDAEAELDMLEERLDAAQGIDGLTRKYTRQVEEAQMALDRLADSVGSPERRDVRVPGTRYSEGDTDEQRALLEDNVVKKSAMGAKQGRPGKDWGDKDAVKAEILRLRGKDVKVAVEKLVKQLGGSGQYTYDPATGERLIEVAINARSPLGTARHEALHDLFRFLSKDPATRSIAKDLRDATSAPHVIRQLRELLKDHKAALEQLNDPEERAAYAYQFWAEGLLRLGPTGTGVFGTIRQFIKDLFGIVTAGQRGEDLLRAFHDGKFADPSTVQEVLQDINDSSGDRVANKLNRAAPALTRAVDSLLSAAPERLRRFENDHLNELADKFQPESGTGFVQNRFQQEGVWTNRLGGILHGTTAVERREAIDQLQSMKPTSKLAKELSKFNEDIYEYMRDAGVQSWDSTTKKFVPLRKVQGYFTRSWDPDAIARNRSEFETLLRTEGGVSAANAAALVENLVRGSEQRPKPNESPVDLGFMPYAPHTSERVLTFINPGNADKFAKFQRKDLADIMTSYVRGATHRAEYAREFGNNGEKIVELVAKSGIKDDKELGEISNAVQALEGSLDPGNWSVQTKEAMSALMTLQNVTLLPLALVSQMIDPIVLAARTGNLKDAGVAYMTALKRLKNTITKSKNKVPGEELAEILGVVSEDSTLQAMSMAYGATRMSKRMENINRVFFKYNGMQGWNNSMRIAATAAGERYLLANKGNAEALAELGLEPKDIKDTGGKLDVSSPKVQQAMFQFVDQAVLRPSAANRPVWMSDPRFLLVAHLKQFTFAMHNVVLKRASRELQNDNPKPWGVLMLAMPVILAADMAKFALTGTAPSTWGFKDYLVHAVERSGVLGIGDFGVQAMGRVDSGKMPGEGLLGPTFENLMEILRWIGGDPRTGFEDVADRTVPGYRFI